jgi:hypothetical protein
LAALKNFFLHILACKKSRKFGQSLKPSPPSPIYSKSGFCLMLAFNSLYTSTEIQYW